MAVLINYIEAKTEFTTQDKKEFYMTKESISTILRQTHRTLVVDASIFLQNGRPEVNLLLFGPYNYDQQSI